MNKCMELEDRILRNLLTQYVGIFQINISEGVVLCLSDGERVVDKSKTISLRHGSMALLIYAIVMIGSVF